MEGRKLPVDESVHENLFSDGAHQSLLPVDDQGGYGANATLPDLLRKERHIDDAHLQVATGEGEGAAQDDQGWAVRAGGSDENLKPRGNEKGLKRLQSPERETAPSRRQEPTSLEEWLELQPGGLREVSEVALDREKRGASLCIELIQRLELVGDPGKLLYHGPEIPGEMVARLLHPENQGTGQAVEHSPGHLQLGAREDPLVRDADHFVVLLPSLRKNRRPRPKEGEDLFPCMPYCTAQ